MDDFLSILVYLPKERYSFGLKERILSFLSEEFDGVISSEQVLMSEFPFARLITVLSFDSVREFTYDKHHLQEKLNELSLSWEDRLDQLILSSELKADYKLDFPASYRDSFSPNWALEDVKNSLEALDTQGIVFSLDHDNTKETVILKVFHPEKALPLSLLMPMLENFGLCVSSEMTYEIGSSSYQNSKNQSVWIHYFYSENEKISKEDQQRIIEALYDVWSDRVENDAFNHLILKVLSLLSLNFQSVCSIFKASWFWLFSRINGQCVKPSSVNYTKDAQFVCLEVYATLYR